MLDKNIFKNNLLLIFFIFFFTRIILFYFFEIQPNEDFSGSWQILNSEFLKNNLFESIINLIFQPPLWNLFIGFILKFFKDISSVVFFFYFFNILITLFIIIITFQLCKIYQLSKIKKFLLALLIILNPSIYFYETNAPNYEPISCLILIIQFLIFIKYFNKYSFKLLVLIYINFLILIYIWSAFSPIILIIFFAFDSFLKKKIIALKKNILIFFFFLILSILPAIKNYYLFDYFNNGSHGIGWHLAMTTSSIKNDFSIHHECGVVIEESWNQIYYNKYNVNTKAVNISNLPSKNFSNLNVLGRITKSQYCLKKSIDYIKDNLKLYILARGKEIVISHTQFAVDISFIVGHPKNFDKIKFLLKQFHDNFFYKKIKQFFLISFFLFVYLIIAKEIILEKKKYLKYSYILIILLYFYFLAVATIFSNYEGSRFIHTFFIIQLIFWLIFLKKFNIIFKNLKNFFCKKFIFIKSR